MFITIKIFLKMLRIIFVENIVMYYKEYSHL